jgi:ribosomal protein S18 acetylase RimI-like enzyme
MPETGLRPAGRDDAADLARLADLASEGMARFLWARMGAPGEDPLAIGIARAARDEGAFSWRNAILAEVGGAVAGLLVHYRIGTEPAPLDDQPGLFQPLQRLENRALDTHYVNILATYPAFRHRGVGRALLEAAERSAGDARGLSLIVADRNAPARRLYRRFGFVEAAAEPIVADGWQTDSTAWLLMLKPA